MLALACGCGATDGAASVHGALYATDPTFASSFDFVSGAEIHGIGPFRIHIVNRDPAARGEAGRDGLPVGQILEVRQPRRPLSGEPAAIGGDEGAVGTADVVKAPGEGLESREEGTDLLYSDGGFHARAVSGDFQIDYEHSRPGDGVTGRFRLEFQTGEVVQGTFASAFAD
jgi:hypothetical protein